MQIRFIDQQVPSDKTEKPLKNVFRMAGQIMFNYYILALKKDPRQVKNKYNITLTK